jgi:signal transduction histidine kinase
LIGLSFIFYLSSKEAIIDRTSAQLSSINILKKRQIEEYFKFKEKSLKIFLVDILKEEHLLEKGDEKTLFEHAVNRNISRMAGELGFLNAAYLDKDLNLINISDSTDEDFVHVLKDHEVGDDELKKIWNSPSHSCSTFDIVPFEDDTELKVLMICPLKDDKEETIGILVLEQQGDRIQDILYERTGMGATGESYVVAKDFKMRSHSRFFPDKNPGFIQVKTKAVRNAFDGIKNVELIKDYRDVEVLSAYRKLEVSGLEWVIITEIDYSEAMQPVYELGLEILIVASLLAIAVVLISIFISSKIAKPIVNLKLVIAQLAKGIIPLQKPQAKEMDEIGDMTNAIGTLIEGLKRNSNFAFEIGNGNFKTQYEPLSDGDMLGQSLLQMRDKLKALQNKEAEIMRERSSALLEGQEKERRRLSRELHDGIGQMLTAVRLRASTLQNDAVATDIKNIIDDTIKEIRRMSVNVMPSVLFDFGLEAALKTLCSNLTDYSGILIEYSYKAELPEHNLNFETSASVYRIVQEALNNTIKYSEANFALVEVEHLQEVLKLKIHDNGKGFDAKKQEKNLVRSSGLINMKERTNLLLGDFNIVSNKEEGTTIYISIPLVVKI